MNVTIEPCPICKNPDAKCWHGVKDKLFNALVHFWLCPECGRLSAFVMYHCSDCEKLSVFAEGQCK